MVPAGVAGLFDLVAVVTAAFDDAGVAAVPAWRVQVTARDDLAVERVEQAGEQVRGKRPRDR
jgi:hypothetical protein